MYNKALILSPGKYSITNELINNFNYIAREVEYLDIRNSISKNKTFINTQMFRFPNKIRSKWDSYFLQQINAFLKKTILETSPDIIAIYNNEYFLPETIRWVKSKSIKIVFFMGDNPYYTPTNKYYLQLLTYADLILCPDTFWIHQLSVLGINCAIYFTIGIDSKNYFPLSSRELKDSSGYPETELLYVGMNYVNTWGLKKAMFMNSFSGFDLKIYGNKHWIKWFELYPDLEPHFVLSGFIPTKTLNIMYNKTKIVPIDGNPGLLNGFHIRLVEALGAGAFPLSEYRKDINDRFLKKSKIKLPQISDYSKASDLVSYYLKNEKERKEIVENVRSFVLREYSCEYNAQRIKTYLQ